MYIGVKYIKNDVPQGREYIFSAPEDTKMCDIIELDRGKVMVVRTRIPESEVAGKKIKEIGYDKAGSDAT